MTTLLRHEKSPNTSSLEVAFLVGFPADVADVGAAGGIEEELAVNWRIQSSPSIWRWVVAGVTFVVVLLVVCGGMA